MENKLFVKTSNRINLPKDFYKYTQFQRIHWFEQHGVLQEDLNNEIGIVAVLLRDTLGWKESDLFSNDLYVKLRAYVKLLPGSIKIKKDGDKLIINMAEVKLTISIGENIAIYDSVVVAILSPIMPFNAWNIHMYRGIKKMIKNQEKLAYLVDPHVRTRIRLLGG